MGGRVYHGRAGFTRKWIGKLSQLSELVLKDYPILFGYIIMKPENTALIIAACVIAGLIAFSLWIRQYSLVNWDSCSFSIAYFCLISSITDSIMINTEPINVAINPTQS
jgi:hypothetical protein